MEKQDDTAKSPNPSVVILDGAFCIQITFRNIGRFSFSRQERYRDWIWYLKGLKASTRERGSTGARRRVLPSVTIPRNWQEFLRSDDNKKGLFSFLQEQVVTVAIEDN